MTKNEKMSFKFFFRKFIINSKGKHLSTDVNDSAAKFSDPTTIENLSTKLNLKYFATLNMNHFFLTMEWKWWDGFLRHVGAHNWIKETYGPKNWKLKTTIKILIFLFKTKYPNTSFPFNK